MKFPFRYGCQSHSSSCTWAKSPPQPIPIPATSAAAAARAQRKEMSHTDTAVAEHAPVAKVYRWSAQDGTVRAYIGFSYIEYSRTSFTAVAEQQEMAGLSLEHVEG